MGAIQEVWALKVSKSRKQFLVFSILTKLKAQCLQPKFSEFPQLSPLISNISAFCVLFYNVHGIYFIGKNKLIFRIWLQNCQYNVMPGKAKYGYCPRGPRNTRCRKRRSRWPGKWISFGITYCSKCGFQVQVNLCQKLLFLH